MTAQEIEQLMGLAAGSVVIVDDKPQYTDGSTFPPLVLPAWRILSVMDIHGYTQTVEAIIDNLPVNAKKVAKRQLAGSNIERYHALVLAAQQALNLTTKQVDALFIEADALI